MEDMKAEANAIVIRLLLAKEISGFEANRLWRMIQEGK